MASSTSAAIDTQTESGLRRELTVRDLTLFTIACMVGPRWIPIAAHAGPGSILLWLLASLLFGAPLAVAVPTLMAKHPQTGGLYAWTRNDFGPAHGFIAFWVYWVGMAVWFPGAAVFYISSSSYTFGPSYAHLADSRALILLGSLAAVWIALGSNLIGVKTGKWTENIGAIAIIVLGAILILAAVVHWHRFGSATAIHLKPSANWNTALFWAAIVYGITGAENLGMMSSEIRSPERTVKPAIWLSTSFAGIFYAVITLAMLVLMSSGSINETSGIAAAGKAAGQLLASPWLSPAIGILLLLHAFGAFGGLGSSTSRLPFAAGADRLLPDAFGRVHPRWHTPHVALITLGIVASSLLLLAQLGDTMRIAYQEIVSLTFIGGFLPYLYIFGSAWKAGRRIAAFFGIAVTLFCLICSIIPTADVQNIWLYEGKLAIGTLGMIGSGLFLYSRRRATARPTIPQTI